MAEVKHVTRDETGRINAVYTNPSKGVTKQVSATDPELTAFVAKLNAPPDSFDPPLFKADLFRRMTDTEYQTFETTYAQQSPRKRKIFDSARDLRRSQELWPELEGLFKKVFGNARAAELLQPSITPTFAASGPVPEQPKKGTKRRER